MCRLSRTTMDIAKYEKQLHELTDFVLEENQKVNLTALRSHDQCFIGNVLDSLALIDVLSRVFITQKEGRKILDIGTGGGFPLLPLALIFPDMDFVGLDATKKKTDAVLRIAEKMQLPNVHVATGRSEELGHHPDMREQFDLVVSRAVAPLPTLLEFCAPFAQVGGSIVLWKSMHIADEQRSALNAMKALHMELVDSHTYELPDNWGKRQLLMYKKREPTEERYPRDVGVPKKSPL